MLHIKRVGRGRVNMYDLSFKEVLKFIDSCYIKTDNANNNETLEAYNATVDTIKIKLFDKVLEHNCISLREILDFFRLKTGATINLTQLYMTLEDVSPIFDFILTYDRINESLPTDIYTKNDVLNYAYDTLYESMESFRIFITKLQIEVNNDG